LIPNTAPRQTRSIATAFYLFVEYAQSLVKAHLNLKNAIRSGGKASGGKLDFCWLVFDRGWVIKLEKPRHEGDLGETDA
jgi:hypothetical protein